jgi:hypothetical protein
LAELHGRPLPSSLLDTAKEAVAMPTSASAADLGLKAPDTDDLHQQLRLLRQQVTTLQAQVTELALALVRQSFTHQLPTSAVSVLAPPVPVCTPAPTQEPVRSSARAKALPPPPEPEPTRKRSRALPLIQVRADDSAVVISPTEGVLPLVPDSPAWFDWLGSQTAFGFSNQHSHFSATRKFRHGQRIQSWNVHRSLHGRSCTLYLGQTTALTLARLHDTASAVQARLTGL